MAKVIENVGFSDYDKRIKRRKRVKILIIIVFLLAVASVCVYMVNSYINRVYTSYEVVNRIERQDTEYSNYHSYLDKVLKVSRDGASAINADGSVEWNGSYSMKSPKTAVCQKYVAVADIGNYEVVVFNGSDSGKSIKVDFPIVDIEVAYQGVIAVVMEDEAKNRIQVINPYTNVNACLVDIETIVEKDGFPVNIALSEDGTKLVTSYMAIQNGIVQNKLTFYNFSEVWQNVENRLVGMKEYGKEILADIQFIDNNTIAVFGENFLELFEMKELSQDVTKAIARIDFNEEIKSCFYSDSYIGYTFEDSTTNEYTLIVYNLNGGVVLKKKVDYEYDHIIMSAKEVIFYSDTSCNIIKLNGVNKFSHAFSINVDFIMPINNYDQYYFINNAAIEAVKLTED